MAPEPNEAPSAGPRAAGRSGPERRGTLPTVEAPCFLCGSPDADPVWATPDRAFAVPGIYTVARCRRCGFLYQRPRVRDEHLAECYPDHYPRHQDPSPRIPFKGSPSRLAAVRLALHTGLGYTHLAEPAASVWTRLHARFLLRRLRWDCPPWRGRGRYLDVGCGSGAALGVARSLGWQVAGIEMDEAAAARARRFSEEVYTGDVLSAAFPGARFDVVAAHHVLEHVPDPVAVVRRMLEWLAPDGLLIVEVPDAGGLGAALFGAAWSGLELPRHLSQFTPASLAEVVERAGGRVVWQWHRAQPRHYFRSLRAAFDDLGLPWVARVMERRPVYGLLKLLLEATLPLASRAGRGEIVRVGVVLNSGLASRRARPPFVPSRNWTG